MTPRTKPYLFAFLTAFLLIFTADIKTAFAQVPDPGTPGPLTVTREEYNFGDTAFTATDFPGPIELLASIHYPANLPAGPYPVILFMHGRHATCFVGGSALLQWPCSANNSQSIPSYRGYDYVADVIASHGYVVVSVSANGVNAVDNSVFDLGALARAELLQKHLDILKTFNASGGAPFGTKFVGKLDLTRVGTMGHSRGGEGVVRHKVLNDALGAPYGIKAVFPLAPVDFNRFVVNNAALNVLLPYCDGDVSDLQGVHFYDDARYNVPGDQAPKHYQLVMGANHNFYNTIWSPSSPFPGAANDWLAFVPGGRSDSQCGTVKGSQRLTEAQQRGTGLAYMSAFFRAYVGGETQFLPILTGDAPPPASAQTNNLFVSYHAPDNPELRLDLNRLLNNTNLTINTQGGAATQTGLTPYDLCGGDPPQPAVCLPGQSNARQPHTTPSARSSAAGLSQLRTGWNNMTGNYRNDIPATLGNVAGFQAVQFRVSVNFADARNLEGLAQNFRIVLTDAAGASSSVRVSDVSGALFLPPGKVGPVPKVVLNTVRVPLSAFGGVNLNSVRSVQFVFDERFQGGVLVTDLAFASAPR
ncbi:MAG: hypothetical protein LC794_12360 [Acidobacteria bacterium]|nr:hypothetical protein [Acidobacteriota bacterium]MCA1627462.1 hypothetical protein [Acidobacteriota bacterium]